MDELLEKCRIDKGTYTDGPVLTADVRKLFDRIEELEQKLAELGMNNSILIDSLAEAEQELAALREISHNTVGMWLSAALDDPKVCAEMKQDIHTWMAALNKEVSDEVAV